MAYTEDKAFELIGSAYERGRLGHAFLITGDASAGGESLATRVINLINASDDDGGDDMFDLFGKAPPSSGGKEAENLDELEGDLVRIIRPRSKSRVIKVDEIRSLEKALYQSVEAGKWKVGVVLEADRMMPQAENAFLKTLEEPPNGCLLLLITASPERLLPTILSRCVKLPLISENTERIELEGEKELLTVLARVGRQGFNTVAKALTIKSVFSSILAKRKQEITKQFEAELKEEQDAYGKTTDGTWLKEREDFYVAHIASEYLAERSRFIDLLITWLGDVVRVKCDAPRLDFASQESILKEVAELANLESLLQRMDALEELRRMFETNVSEALALEVGFMKAFG